MNFVTYWKVKIRANPPLALGDQTKMTLTVAAFKAEIEKAYRAGAESRDERHGLEELLEIFKGKF